MEAASEVCKFCQAAWSCHYHQESRHSFPSTVPELRSSCHGKRSFRSAPGSPFRSHAGSVVGTLQAGRTNTGPSSALQSSLRLWEDRGPPQNPLTKAVQNEGRVPAKKPAPPSPGEVPRTQRCLQWLAHACGTGVIHNAGLLGTG